jgi:2-haloacid dehalogenase
VARWATFDCYGTLVDWNAGIAGALGGNELLDRYHELEPAVQAEDPTRTYREVLRETARRMGIDADPASTLPDWPVFPEVRAALTEARSRGWRLAILSNSDRDLIEASIRAIGVPFDLAIVASEIGSYKPALEHWHAFAAAVGRLPDVHVAQSHFHDVVPATRLGIPTIWINRLAEVGDPPATHEQPSLTGLADALEAVAGDAAQPSSSRRPPHAAVEAIHLGPAEGAELRSVASARAVAGRGLEGDRYYADDGAAPGQALTLVEAEVVEDVGLPPGGTRRQVTTRGIRLNDLVGRRFRVGEVECHGVELCEPCAHLESTTRPGIMRELVHRGGINADVLTDGTIAIGDEIVPL